MNEFARVGFNYSSFYYAYILKWQLLNQSITGGYSVIRVQASIYVGANFISWTWGNGRIHDSSFDLAARYNKGETVVYTKDITVNHDANGDASIYISGSINSSFLMNGNCGGTINLPKIDRSAPSVSASIIEVKENSVLFRYSINSSCDSVQVRLNNGVWQSISGNQFTLDNLKEETEYVLQVRAKKTSNQVWGYSNNIQFKTLAGTFVWISKNMLPFKTAEVYLINSMSMIKLSKKQYQIILEEE